MNNVTVYDQLDMAIAAMMANPELTRSATARATESRSFAGDSEFADLVQIAVELCGLPRPDFKARLKTELGWVAASRPLSSPRPSSDTGSDILPSLFGLGPGSYPIRRVNFVASLGMHAVAVVLVAVMGIMAFKTEARNAIAEKIVWLSDYVPPVGQSKPQGGGGGGAAAKLDASKGSAPKVSTKQIVPPSVEVPNQQAKLMVEPTIVAPNLQVPQTNQVGDPLASLMTPSDGRGVGSGIGTGSGGGIGSGTSDGMGPGSGGNFGGGVFKVGNGVTAPHVIFDPEPEYSPEARQAKYQGTVVLWAIIGPDGRPHNLHVKHPLGMGLDEKALEAVSTWRFRPATKDGNPVAVEVEVEVNFHLY